jgi:hypothetical protein
MLRNRGYKYTKLDSIEDNIELLEKHQPNNSINLDPIIASCSRQHFTPPSPQNSPSYRKIEKKDIIDEFYEKPKQIVELLTDKKILEKEPEYDFDIIECIFTKDNPAIFHTIEIKCINTTLFVKNNEIISTLPILVNLTNGVLRIWSPEYTENRISYTDGTTLINGYYVFDYDGNKILVKNKEIMKQFYINFSLSNIVILGDWSIIEFEDNLFNEKDISLKARCYNKINMGKSNFNFIKKDVASTVTII